MILEINFIANVVSIVINFGLQSRKLNNTIWRKCWIFCIDINSLESRIDRACTCIQTYTHIKDIGNQIRRGDDEWQVLLLLHLWRGVSPPINEAKQRFIVNLYE